MSILDVLKLRRLFAAEQPEPVAPPKAPEPPRVPELPKPVQRPKYDPEAVQSEVLELVRHARRDVRIKQLSARSEIPCLEVYRAALELERLGYVRCGLDHVGRMCVNLSSTGEPVEAVEDNPIADHVRICQAIYRRSPVTKFALDARTCDIPRAVRRKVLRELVEAGCIQGCYDYRGVPSYRALTYDQADEGLDAIKARKLGEDRAG